MAAQIDPVSRAGDPRDQGLRKLVLVPDKGEDRAIVILVDVEVEQACWPGQGCSERLERRRVASFGEVGNRFEWQGHARSLGPR